MMTLGETLLNWLVDFYLLGGLLLALVWVAVRLAKSPAQRICWSWGATAALFVLAAAILFSDARLTPVKWSAKLQPWLATTTVAPSRATSALTTDVTTVAQPTAASSAPAKVIITPRDQFRSWLFWNVIRLAILLAWLCGALTTGLLLCWGAWKVCQIQRHSAPVPDWARDELRRCAGGNNTLLRSSSRVRTAVALGALRPSILLPLLEVRDDNQPAMRAAIRHEWAHIAHKDLWLHALQRLLLVPLFAHPLYWLLRKQTRQDQELLADAAAAGTDPLGYAETLLAWAQQAAGKQSRPGAVEALGLTMWRDQSSLSRRIEMLVGNKPITLAPAKLATRAGIISLLLFAALALSTVTLQSEEDKLEVRSAIADLIIESNSQGKTIHGRDRDGRRLVVIHETADRLTMSVHEALPGPDRQLSYTVASPAALKRSHPDAYELYTRFVEAAKLETTRALTDRAADIKTSRQATKALPAPESGPTIIMEATIGEVDHKVFAEDDATMEEIIQEEVEGRCYLEGNTVIALCTAQEVERIKRRLEKARAMEILSLPKVATLENQTARVRIGGEVPFVPDDGRNDAIAYRFEGIALDLSPSIVYPDNDRKAPPMLAIDLTAELTKPLHAKAAAKKTPVVRKVQLRATLDPEQMLLVAERRPKDKSHGATSLFVTLAAKIGEPASAPEAPVAAADVTRLLDENRRLKQRLDVAEKALQSQRQPNPAAADSQVGQPADPKAEQQLRIYHLRFITAEKAVELAQLAVKDKRSVKVIAEPRANSLIVKATADDHDVLSALLTQLDTDGKKD